MRDLALLESRWSLARKFSDPELLRTDVLRALTHWAHSAQSSLLAGIGSLSLPNGKSAHPKELETRLLALRDRALSDLEWLEIFDTTAPLPPRFEYSQIKACPLGREKIDRLDRIWEKELYTRATLRNWKIWIQTASIPIRDAELHHRELQERYWPEGILLYTEKGPENQTRIDSPPGNWLGSWILVLAPRVRPRAESKNMYWECLGA